jgi:Fe-S oxidoreductase
MNPGKVIEPYKLDENLRLGADYHPWEPETHFQFPADHGSLPRATLRCVGVGKCRHYEGGVMCPSFRVTGEEEHSTRGRAHLLWEMTKGEVIRGGWSDQHVKDSLDLCLACKGCKSDCPVGVDVATYKAEFLSHYYRGRRRPLNAYAFGNIDIWARLASNAPGLANLATQLPFLRDIAKLVTGIPPERSIPAFAPRTFRQWWNRQYSRGDGRPRELALSEVEGSSRAKLDSRAAGAVLLWPDTFNNYFLPDTAIAAVEVLESAGFFVYLPPKGLCCGRPLYDHGMLDRAKSLLLEILDVLQPEIEYEVPIVVLEPSCASVFRDELINLFPRDERAQKLSRQVFLLSEFLENHSVPLPKLACQALLHGHCHHKSIMKMTAEEAILSRMGIDFRSPASGCCGMAGAFGFERDKYDISLAVGELELLPAVRAASPECLIIADGFSCREQIAQCTDRHALHLAEVIQMALYAEDHMGTSSVGTGGHVGTGAPARPVERGSTAGTPEPALSLAKGLALFETWEPYPERSRVLRRQIEIDRSMTRAGIGLAAATAGAALLWALAKRR